MLKHTISEPAAKRHLLLEFYTCKCTSRMTCVELNTIAGYVAIVGKPNAGKSTLLNAIMRQKLSIVTSKAQTTRHRIIAAHSEDDFQCIFLDTPGVLRPVARPVRPALSRAHILHTCRLRFWAAALQIPGRWAGSDLQPAPSLHCSLPW